MVLPLLGIMLVAIIFGGMTFFNYVELANAVGVGARTLGTTGRLQGTSACTTANTALTTAAGNLNASQITIAPETFALGYSCTSVPIQGDAATITATYPCNLPIPFTSMNLCPVQGGVTQCPTPYCISATTTVYIE